MRLRWPLFRPGGAPGPTPSVPGEGYPLEVGPGGLPAYGGPGVPPALPLAVPGEGYPLGVGGPPGTPEGFTLVAAYGVKRKEVLTTAARKARTKPDCTSLPRAGAGA